MESTIISFVPYLLVAAVAFVGLIVIFTRDVLKEFREELREQRQFFTDWNQRIEDRIKVLADK